MLAVIGFITTGLIILAFAATFDKYLIQPYGLRLWQFSAAYYCLAAAMFVWGLASIANTPDILRFSALAGDGLLIAATGLLAALVVPGRHLAKLTVAEIVIGTLLLCERAIFFPPRPEIQNGILLFNTQRPVAVVLGIALALIWLPVNIRVARVVTEAVKRPEITQLYTTLYAAGVLSALLFLGTKRFSTVVLSFSGLTMVFLLLVGSNYTVRKLHHARDHHAK